MGLVGLWFHTFRTGETRTLHHQGWVVGHPEPGLYLVEYFDWWVGDSWGIGLVPISDMAAAKDLEWRFYRTREAMHDAYENLPLTVKEPEATGCQRALG
jgi:hypothetical protein